MKVYDSLYPSNTSMLKAQIACLLCTQQGEIPLSKMDVSGVHVLREVLVHEVLLNNS